MVQQLKVILKMVVGEIKQVEVQAVLQLIKTYLGEMLVHSVKGVMAISIPLEAEAVFMAAVRVTNQVLVVVQAI